MGSLKDKAEALDYEIERAKHDETKAQLRKARATVKAQQADLERLEVVARTREGKPDPQPKWLKPRAHSEKTDHRAIVCAMLSDLHLDEVISPQEMNGLNAFNRDIALYRLEQFFQGVELLTRDYVAGVRYEGLVLPLGGDLVSGAIHEELRETNAAPVLATVKYWYPKIADGISYLADIFGRVHVPCVPGNHGRLTQKPRFKLSALDNADWLMCSLIEDRLAGDDRITFANHESLDVQFDVYNLKFLMNHGQTGGGQGIGGIWPPIMRLKARKAAAFDFDWFICGHWHQYTHGQGLTINGSLKGFDEFAKGHAFSPERPQQALWVVTPENGITMAAPVFCGGNPKPEGWAKHAAKH